LRQKLAKLNKTAGNLDDIIEESQRTELNQSGTTYQKTAELTRSHPDMSVKTELFDSLIITENDEATKEKNMQKNSNTASTENFKKKPETSTGITGATNKNPKTITELVKSNKTLKAKDLEKLTIKKESKPQVILKDVQKFEETISMLEPIDTD